MDRALGTAVWWNAPIAVLGDLVRLCKPRVTVMVIVTALGGMWLAVRMAGAVVTLASAAAALFGIVLVVCSANALNMHIERDADALMERTKNRPLPAGRLQPRTALVFGVALGALSIPLLGWLANGLTALLAAASLFLYVGVYTPLKRVTPSALMIGAIPGAAPPLLGWTAATGRLDALGLALFSLLFFWQLPHFLAIATFRRDEYTRAGIRVYPAIVGDRVTRLGALLFSLALVASSLALVPLGLAGPVYVAGAVTLGAAFVLITARTGAQPVPWARGVFHASLVYLPLLIAMMMVSA